MTVLFYLPVVTPWWFDNVVEPLIRRLAAIAEVVVLAPKEWRGTGIGTRELERCSDLETVRWCIMDGDDHPSTRTRPRSADEIVAFVQELAPDFVLCRSADVETVARFPGQVRFLMEAGVAPFPTPPHWIVLQEQPLDHAHLPSIDGEDRAWLNDAIAPAWAALRDRQAEAAPTREAVFEACGIEGDRPVLLLPLEYDHAENFFAMHRVGARPNHRLVEDVVGSVGPDFLVAVTNHPLNELYVPRDKLEAAIARLGNRAVLIPSEVAGLPSTLALAPHVAGMIVGDSKSFALATFSGTPVLRRSRFEIGQWVRAYSDEGTFLKAVRSCTAERASEQDAHLWSAFHLVNNAFDPQDTDLGGEMILDRIARPLSRDRWQAGFERVRAAAPELFR